MAQPWFMEILEQHDPEFARLVAENREVVMKDGATPGKSQGQSRLGTRC